MDTEIVLSITVGILSLLVMLLIGWQICDYKTLKKRTEKKVKEYIDPLIEVAESKLKKEIESKLKDILKGIIFNNNAYSLLRVVEEYKAASDNSNSN